MKHTSRTTLTNTAHRDGARFGCSPHTWEKAMRKTIRKATFGLIAIALLTGATIASHPDDGIEVLGIEVLSGGAQLVHVHTIAPEGSLLVAVANYGAGDIILEMRPVSPEGLDSMLFPINDPSNRIELLAPDGIEVLDVVFVGGNGYEIWELD